MRYLAMLRKHGLSHVFGELRSFFHGPPHFHYLWDFFSLSGASKREQRIYKDALLPYVQGAMETWPSSEAEFCMYSGSHHPPLKRGDPYDPRLGLVTAMEIHVDNAIPFLLRVLTSEYAPRLRSLRLGADSPSKKEILKLAYCPQIASLTKLNLSGHLSPTCLNLLCKSPYLTGLTSFSWSASFFSPSQLRALNYRSFNDLESLSLLCEPLRAESLFALAQGSYPALKTLDLCRVCKTALEDRSLKALAEACPALTSLELTQLTQISYEDATKNVINALPAFQKLETLILRNFTFHEAKFSEESLKGLKSLRVVQSEITDKDLKSVVDQGMFRSLVGLSFSGTSLNPDALQTFLPDLQTTAPKLRQLDLCRTGITSLEALPSSHSALETLNLSCNNLTTENICAYLTRACLPSLKKLSFPHNNNIDMHTINNVIASNMNLPHLEDLSLQG